MNTLADYVELTELVSRCSARLLLDVRSSKIFVGKTVDEHRLQLELAVADLMRQVDVFTPAISDGVSPGQVLSEYVPNEGSYVAWVSSGNIPSRIMDIDRVRIGVVDDIIGNYDRNGTNLLVAWVDGVRRVVPIDHEGVDTSRYGGVPEQVRVVYRRLGVDAASVVLQTLTDISHAQTADLIRSEVSSRSGMALVASKMYLKKFQEQSS